MRKLLAILVILGSVVALAIPAIAQTGYDITINTVSDDDFPRLQLLVTVMDENERPVLGLGEADFEVLFDGQPVRIVSVEEIRNADLGVSAVLVLDTSDSMFITPLENTQAAANVLLDSLRPQDELAILEFDSTVRVLQGFSSDFEAARPVIAGLVADGKTALYEAAYRGVEQALTTANPRRVMILVTDGQDYGSLSTVPASAAVDLAVANNIPIYAIGFGTVYEPYLRGLAEATEGQAFILPDSERLPEIFDFIANYLRSQYVVTVEPVVEPDGASHELAVQIGAGLSAPYSYTTPDLYPQIGLDALPTEAIETATSVDVTAIAPRGIGAVTVSVDGQEVPQEDPTTSSDNTVYTSQVVLEPYALAPGEHTLRAEARDTQGGMRAVEETFTVASLPVEFSLDLEPDELISTPERVVTVDVARTQGAVEAVAFRVDDGPLTTVDAAPYTYTLDALALGAGPHVLEVTASNTTGTTTTRPFAFSVDGALFITPTPTPTHTPTPTDTPVPTDTPTHTPTPTDTPVPTDTPTHTPTPTDTPVPTDTPTTTPAPTDTPVPTDTPTNTPVPTDTPVPTNTPTNTPFPTNTPAPTDTLAPSVTPPPTNTPVPYSFQVSGLQPGAIVREQTTVQVDAGEGEPPIDSVVFAIDNEAAGRVNVEPFTFTIDPAQLGEGAHALGVLVTGEDASIGVEVIPFSVILPTAVPPTTEPTDTAVPPTDTAVPVTELAAVPTDTTEPPTAEPTDTAVPPTATTAPTDTPAPYRFTISGLESGAVLNGPVTVTVEPAPGQPPIRSVEFALDDVVAAAVTTAPFAFDLDALALGAGEHELGIIVNGENQGRGMQVIPFTVELPPTEAPTATAIPTERPTEEPTAVPATEVPPVTFTLSGLEPGAILDTPITTVEVVPGEGQTVAGVTFSIDDAAGETVAEPPYQITLDALALGAGAHTLGVTVEREDGETASDTVGFTVADSLFETPPTAVGEGARQLNDLLIIGGGLLLFLLALIVWSLRRRTA